APDATLLGVSCSIPIRVLLVVLGLSCASVARAQDAELVLRCTVVSPVPDPDEVSYEDCLTTLRFDVEQNISGTVDSDTVVGVFWGMRFGKKSPAAALAVGDRIQGKFVQWALRARKLEAFPRIDKTKDFESPVRYAVEWHKLEDGAAPKVPTDAPAADDDDDSDEPSEPAASSHAPDDRTMGERIRAVLRAHGGQPIGGPPLRDFANRFFDYDYLVQDRFWDVPPGADADGPLAVIADFRRQLDARGVRLHVVFVPCGAAALPGLATRTPYDANRDGRIDDYFQAFAKEVAALGVGSSDCLPTLLSQPVRTYLNAEYPAYLVSAPYWAPWAAAECAQMVANQIRALPDAAQFGEWKKYMSTTRKVTERISTKISARFGASVSSNTLFEIVQPEEKAKGVLLGRDDDASTIWVLGDRWTSIHGKRKSDFASHLAAEIGAPVRVFATRGDDPHEARRRLCDHGIPAHVKLLVWQISVPSLADPASWNRYSIAK
ncbi:MAG: hypothetical protein KDB80_14125, partial [Planctomycetes bacterium]|nr:hypothetical protein [Planctomycetota bacterium]